jgi:hypothetical protein
VSPLPPRGRLSERDHSSSTDDTLDRRAAELIGYCETFDSSVFHAAAPGNSIDRQLTKQVGRPRSAMTPPGPWRAGRRPKFAPDSASSESAGERRAAKCRTCSSPGSLPGTTKASAARFSYRRSQRSARDSSRSRGRTRRAEAAAQPLKPWRIRWSEPAGRDLRRSDLSVAQRVVRVLDETADDSVRFSGT